MMFDTAAGALPIDLYGGDVSRDVRAIANAHPGKVGYYARDLSDAHEKAAGFETIPLAGIGLDMQRDLAVALRNSHRSGFVHGNLDTSDLLLTGDRLEQSLERFWPLCAPSTQRRGGVGCAASGTASCPVRLRTASGDS